MLKDTDSLRFKKWRQAFSGEKRCTTEETHRMYRLRKENASTLSAGLETLHKQQTWVMEGFPKLHVFPGRTMIKWMLLRASILLIFAQYLEGKPSLAEVEIEQWTNQILTWNPFNWMALPIFWYREFRIPLRFWSHSMSERKQKRGEQNGRRHFVPALDGHQKSAT